MLRIQRQKSIHTFDRVDRCTLLTPLTFALCLLRGPLLALCHKRSGPWPQGADAQSGWADGPRVVPASMHQPPFHACLGCAYPPEWGHNTATCHPSGWLSSLSLHSLLKQLRSLLKLHFKSVRISSLPSSVRQTLTSL